MATTPSNALVDCIAIVQNQVWSFSVDTYVCIIVHYDLHIFLNTSRIYTQLMLGLRLSTVYTLKNKNYYLFVCLAINDKIIKCPLIICDN